MNLRARFFYARTKASERAIAAREVDLNTKVYKIADVPNHRYMKMYDRVAFCQKNSAIVLAVHSPSFKRCFAGSYL